MVYDYDDGSSVSALTPGFVVLSGLNIFYSQLVSCVETNFYMIWYYQVCMCAGYCIMASSMETIFLRVPMDLIDKNVFCFLHVDGEDFILSTL